MCNVTVLLQVMAGGGVTLDERKCAFHPVCEFLTRALKKITKNLQTAHARDANEIYRGGGNARSSSGAPDETAAWKKSD